MVQPAYSFRATSIPAAFSSAMTADSTATPSRSSVDRTDSEPTSLGRVRADLARRAPDLRIEIARSSTATVALAAAAFGVPPAQIAKTLALRVGDRVLLVSAVRIAPARLAALTGDQWVDVCQPPPEPGQEPDG